ncbi:MAG: hypothetical protein IPJ65_07015 [Archangiaceae bacterium]|nr:hypothetical protein [Archangiaceae bacterium]
MSASRTAPAPLRVVHAIVFLGFASASVAATHQELLQLFRALAQPFNWGTPPQPIACAAGLASALLGLGLIARVVMGKAVPLWLSAALLLSFGGSLFVLGVEPRARTVPGANVKCLEQAKVLHAQLNAPLQQTGRVPAPDAPAMGLSGESPFYARPFDPLAWSARRVKSAEVLPEGAQPGWLLVQVPEDGASFVITAVGIDDDGRPAVLRQEGKPIEYRGAYNPDTAQ